MHTVHPTVDTDEKTTLVLKVYITHLKQISSFERRKPSKQTKVLPKQPIIATLTSYLKLLLRLVTVWPLLTMCAALWLRIPGMKL